MGLDIVELVIEVETTFAIEIPDADVRDLATVGDLYDYIARRIQSHVLSPQGGPYTGALWERYLDVLEKETGLKRHRLQPGARFIRDLGLE